MYTTYDVGANRVDVDLLPTIENPFLNRAVKPPDSAGAAFCCATPELGLGEEKYEFP